MSQPAVCIVETPAQAESLVRDLNAAGVPCVDISVLFPNPAQTDAFAADNETKGPEGAMAGLGAGGLVGGALGLLAGLGAFAIPGLGPFVAAGPIMAALSGAAAGAAIGGIAGALVGMGVPEEEARAYEGRVKEGGILVAVHSSTTVERDRARDIFLRFGVKRAAHL